MFAWLEKKKKMKKKERGSEREKGGWGWENAGGKVVIIIYTFPLRATKIKRITCYYNVLWNARTIPTASSSVVVRRPRRSISWRSYLYVIHSLATTPPPIALLVHYDHFFFLLRAYHKWRVYSLSRSPIYTYFRQWDELLKVTKGPIF